MKLKPGMKVRVKSRDFADTQRAVGPHFVPEMYRLCGQVITIMDRCSYEDTWWKVKEDNAGCAWLDTWFEPLVMTTEEKIWSELNE